jgi:hypothetical protein
MYTDTLAYVFLDSFRDLAVSLTRYLPLLAVSVAVFILGWVVAASLGRWVERLAARFGLDAFLASLGVAKPLERAGLELHASLALGGFVRWFIVLVVLTAVSDVLRLSAVSLFLRAIATYLPQLVTALLILLAGAIIADFLERLVRASTSVAHAATSGFLGTLTRGVIWLFALLTALDQLGVAEDLLQTITTGIIAMLAIAGGIAFGLGGREAAATLIDTVRREVTRR